MRIGLDPPKSVPAEKKAPQKLTPTRQIENNAFNSFVELGRYTWDLKQEQTRFSIGK